MLQRRLLILASFFCLIAAGLLIVSLFLGGTTPPNVHRIDGTLPRGLYMIDAQGKAHPIPQGRFLLLNLWATWCAPCVAELPALAALGAKYPALDVIALSVDVKGFETVAPFLASDKVSSYPPVYADENLTLFKTLKPEALPTSLLIAPDGHLLYRIDGEINWQDARKTGWLSQELDKK